MSEETKEVEKKVTGLLAEVADQIKGSAPQVYERLRDQMVERELADRVALLDKAFAKRRDLTNNLNKVNRPDNVTYNADGTEAAGTYTKERLNEIKKAREVLEKLENAMERALSQNDFGKLKDAVK